MNPATPTSPPILALPPGRGGRRRAAWTSGALLVALAATMAGPTAAAAESVAVAAKAPESERPRIEPCDLAVLRALLGLAPLSREACPQFASDAGEANRIRAARLAEEARLAQAQAEAAEAEAAAAEEKALRAEATVRERSESGDDRETRS